MLHERLIKIESLPEQFGKSESPAWMHFDLRITFISLWNVVDRI